MRAMTAGAAGWLKPAGKFRGEYNTAGGGARLAGGTYKIITFVIPAKAGI